MHMVKTWLGDWKVASENSHFTFVKTFTMWVLAIMDPMCIPFWFWSKILLRPFQYITKHVTSQKFYVKAWSFEYKMDFQLFNDVIFN
jgi:hypothetical protein